MNIGSISALQSPYLQQVQNQRLAAQQQAVPATDRDHDGDSDLSGVDNNDGKGRFINVTA